MSEHRCYATGCREIISPQMLMCAKHWYAVPRELQAAVWRHYRWGQERDKNPSPEYLAAARAAIASVQ